MDVPPQKGTGVMKRLSFALALGAAVSLLLVDTLVAQRAGGYDLSQYMGNVRYDGKFVFVRMSYATYSRTQPWAHDYPWGERRFMTMMTALTNINAHVQETSIMSFTDPEMYKFPVIYLVEPGLFQISDAEALALRNYLLKGGFLIVDDFPRQQWGQFELNMTKVFPDGEWKELGAQHPIFHSFYEIPDLSLVPASYNLGGQPMYFGMFEGNDLKNRMYVMVNYQQDISEYWEANPTGFQVVDEAQNQAFKMGVNQFIYGITH